MTSTEWVDLAGKVLLVPSYYSETEKEINLAATFFAGVIGYFVAPLLIPKSNIAYGVTVVVLIVAGALYFAFLYTAGIFWLQTLCRAVVFLLLGFILTFRPNPT
jgi:hypothetical protein